MSIYSTSLLFSSSPIGVSFLLYRSSSLFLVLLKMTCQSPTCHHTPLSGFSIDVGPPPLVSVSVINIAGLLQRCRSTLPLFTALLARSLSPFSSHLSASKIALSIFKNSATKIVGCSYITQ
eukprot:Gb_26172 [translate_table: standard]